MRRQTSHAISSSSYNKFTLDVLAVRRSNERSHDSHTAPPEALLERCADKIEREANPKDQADLLVVSQVMTGLRFPDPELLGLFGGKRTMIESPLLQKWFAERMHKAINEVLKARFGSVPRDVTRLLRQILDEERLTTLTVLAAQCPNMETYREALLS